MKYVITLVLLIAVVLNGLTGYHFFQHSHYDLSSLMIVASYLSIVMSIYVLTVGRRKSVQ
jgi:L-asparagine transporter-like permease